METTTLATAPDQPKILSEEMGAGKTERNITAPKSPLPFGVPSSSTMSCGYGLEEMLSVAREIWQKVDVPEVTNHYHLELDTTKDGGLRLSFGYCAIDYGHVTLRPLGPQVVKIEADTVLHQLENLPGAAFHLENTSLAIAWTSDLTHRLCRLNQVWSSEEIYFAARERHERIYSYPPQW